MKRKARMVTAAAVTVAGLATAGVAAASQVSSEDSETPIAGDDLQQASDAALASTGEGRVTETEVGDEESYYEVEVTLDDGSEVDVQLDKNFEVVGSEAETGSEQDDSD